MKPIWLIETGVWKDNSVNQLISLLRGLGLTVHAEQYTYLGGTEFELVDEDCPVIFYGSLNTAEYLRALRRNWVPLIWFDSDAFSCRSYYAHWGKHLLQERYGFYPLAEVGRLKSQLYQAYGKDDMIFVRPDENDKSFSGRLVPWDNFPLWYEELRADKIDPAALVVVSSPVQTGAEYRCVIANGQVIACSGYKGGDKVDLASDSLGAATRFAQEVAAQSWQPRVIYCLDVTCTGAGDYRVVEIGGINSAGLYRCDLPPVVRAMNENAVRDYQHWKGRA